MSTIGFVIFSIVACGFFAAAILMWALTRQAWKTRVPTRLLVTEVEPYRDRDGDRFFRIHYLVLDSDHAGTRAVSSVNGSPAMHEKHVHLEGWYNPADGTAVSRKEAAVEKHVPLYLAATAAFVFVLGIAIKTGMLPG